MVGSIGRGDGVGGGVAGGPAHDPNENVLTSELPKSPLDEIISFPPSITL
jgi:hypothetical protein